MGRRVARLRTTRAALLAALLATGCAGTDSGTAPITFCPDTPQLDAALVSAADGAGLDYAIDCSDPGATRVAMLRGDGSCQSRRGELCVPQRDSMEAGSVTTTTLAERARAALNAWLARQPADR